VCELTQTQGYPKVTNQLLSKERAKTPQATVPAVVADTTEAANSWMNLAELSGMAGAAAGVLFESEGVTATTATVIETATVTGVTEIEGEIEAGTEGGTTEIGEMAGIETVLVTRQTSAVIMIKEFEVGLEAGLELAGHRKICDLEIGNVSVEK